MAGLFIDSQGQIVCDEAYFDPWRHQWLHSGQHSRHASFGSNGSDLRPISPREALRHLNANAKMRRVPVGVIGPREATAGQCAIAETLGQELADLGLALLCGGKNGVMEAVCRGHAQAGGQPIGLLPDDDWHAANDFVAIPIATGIGNARNAIIARACFALIAVGGGYGTLSEMAFGLHYGRLVLTLDEAPDVAGAVRCADVEEAVDLIA